MKLNLVTHENYMKDYRKRMKAKLGLPKPKKKVSISKLKKKADTLFSLIIRSKGYCELMGLDGVKCGQVLQCAHIETRGVLAIRWSEENALCLCNGHHWFYTNNESKWQEVIKRLFPTKYKFYLKHKNDHMTETYDEVLSRLSLNRAFIEDGVVKI